MVTVVFAEFLVMPKTKICCKTTIILEEKRGDFFILAEALKVKNEEKAFFSNYNFKSPPNTLISFSQRWLPRLDTEFLRDSPRPQNALMLQLVVLYCSLRELMEAIGKCCANTFPYPSEFLLLENIFQCCCSISVSAPRRNCHSGEYLLELAAELIHFLLCRTESCILPRTLQNSFMKLLFAIRSICVHHQVSRFCQSCIRFWIRLKSWNLMCSHPCIRDQS